MKTELMMQYRLTNSRLNNEKIECPEGRHQHFLAGMLEGIALALSIHEGRPIDASREDCEKFIAAMEWKATPEKFIYCIDYLNTSAHSRNADSMVNQLEKEFMHLLGMDCLEISGSDFCITGEDVDPDLWEDLKACSHQGDCEGTVKAFLSKWQVKVSTEDAKAYLKPYGAWDEEGLQDHSENLMRLVWVLAGNINDSENEEGYLSQY